MTANLEAFFDTNWYYKRYPDVEKTGMQPLQHYLRYGERLGRKPGPAFDPLFYAENYPELADTESSLLAHFTAYGQRKGKRGYAQTIQELMQQLWRRGHTADCIDALVAFTEKGPPGEVRSAAWVLARWFAFQEDWHYCAYWLRLYYQQPEPKVPWPVIQLMYCEALCRLGKPVEAEEEAQALKERFPDHYDANLAFSNIYLSKLESAPSGGSGSEQVSQLNARRIDVINTLLAQHGLRQIEGENNHQALTLDSIKPVDTHLKESQWGGAGLVSVIVPVFNAERFLATALKSLMVQSYPDLEVLIVDDASTDATRSIAEQFVAQDARFTLLCQPFNQGAYAARNHGLKHARGDYITVHDADDWSHPDKISCQLSAFDKNPEWLANTADMVRCTTNLRFGRWRLPNTPYGGWIYRNTSSLIFKRKVSDTLGCWDRVRCSGDTEYLHRITAAFGNNAYGEIYKGIPLSFCRHQEGSLSQISELHLVTHEKGLRRDYMRAAKKWHSYTSKVSDLYLDDLLDQRPFPAPALNIPG